MLVLLKVKIPAGFSRKSRTIGIKQQTIDERKGQSGINSYKWQFSKSELAPLKENEKVFLYQYQRPTLYFPFYESHTYVLAKMAQII